MFSVRFAFLTLLLIISSSALQSMLNEAPSGNLDTNFLELELTFVADTSSKTSMSFVQQDEEEAVWLGDCNCELSTEDFVKDSDYLEYAVFIVGNCDCPGTDPDARDNDLWDGEECDCTLIPWNFSDDSGLLTYATYITDSECECLIYDINAADLGENIGQDYGVEDENFIGSTEELN